MIDNLLRRVRVPKKRFNDVFFPYLHSTNRIENIMGGAGSGKSKFMAQKKVAQHLEDKRRNTLIVRNVGNTNRHSTFPEIVDVINEWGLQNLFHIRNTDMTITRKGGGQMRFSGLDDVEKLKSIKFHKGILTDIWGEEATEMSEHDVVQLNLRMRGKNSPVPFQMSLTYNPISALHWLKKKYHDVSDKDISVLKTTYLDNRFIDDAYVKELNKLKIDNPMLYQIFALGEWGMMGDLVYTNYEIAEFDDNFSEHYNALDWGFNDPAAGLKAAFYDQVIYIIDEFYVTGQDNPELMTTAETIWDKSTDSITADSAEPKSIKTWRTNGWNIKGAKKGKGSIKHGIGWVRSHKMIIHPRCQNFINEIHTYGYRKDKDGNLTEEPVDYRNHLMDDLRYAFEKKMIERKIQWVA